MEDRKDQDSEVTVSEEALREAEKYVEEEEGPSRRLSGWVDKFVTCVAVASTLFHLYAAVGVVITQMLRGIHVGIVLFLTFLVYPARRGAARGAPSGTTWSSRCSAWR